MAAIKFSLNGKPQTVDVVPQMPLLWVLRDTIGLIGNQVRLRHGAVRRVHCPPQWSADSFMRHPDIERRREEHHHDRRPFSRWQPSCAKGVD